MTRKANLIKAQSDKIVKLAGITSPVTRRFASAHIKMNGFYAYTEGETNKKVFVTA